jgi:protein-tyrosine-phosphatase
VSVAHRHGLRIGRNRPTPLEDVLHDDDLLVAVCDNAHEELARSLPRLHWSVPDPVRIDSDAAFEEAYGDINRRVNNLAAVFAPTRRASLTEPGERYES